MKCLMHRHKELRSDSQHPGQKAGTVVYPCNPNAREAEAGGPLELDGQTSSLIGELEGQ